MALGALLFDVDGTLADTEAQGHRPAYNRAFAAYGLDWHWTPEVYTKLLPISGGMQRIRYFIDAYQPWLGDNETAFRINSNAWIRALHQLKAHFFRQQLASGWVRLRPGVLRVLEHALESGLCFGLVSNASRATVEAVYHYCVKNVLGDVASIIVTGDDTPRPKPDPASYTLACQQLNMRPDRALAIEDSPIGLQSARAAGVPTLITTSEETRQRSFPGALAVVDSLDDPGRQVGDGIHIGAFERVDLDTLRMLHGRRHFQNRLPKTASQQRQNFLPIQSD